MLEMANYLPSPRLVPRDCRLAVYEVADDTPIDIYRWMACRPTGETILPAVHAVNGQRLADARSGILSHCSERRISRWARGLPRWSLFKCPSRTTTHARRRRSSAGRPRSSSGLRGSQIADVGPLRPRSPRSAASNRMGRFRATHCRSLDRRRQCDQLPGRRLRRLGVWASEATVGHAVSPNRAVR